MQKGEEANTESLSAIFKFPGLANESERHDPREPSRKLLERGAGNFVLFDF